MTTKIFLTGATGYIGGSVLATLLEFPHKYKISALIRNPEHAEPLKKLGVTPVIGSLDDSDLLAKHAQEADAVVSAAHADHLPSVQALVRGLKAKKTKSAVLLHTSGTGLLTFSGEPIETPYDDEDIERIHNIPITAPHKDVDSWIFENTEDITVAIIAPSTINGIGTGPVGKVSAQVIKMIKASAIRKKAGWVGENKDVRWGNVNIHDLVELYRIVLDGLLTNSIENGKQGGWYFGSTAEHTWGKIAEGIGSYLKTKGLVDTSEVSTFEKDYYEKYLKNNGLESESRCIANRSRKIGWKPYHPDVYQTLEQEIQYLIDNGQLV